MDIHIILRVIGQDASFRICGNAGRDEDLNSHNIYTRDISLDALVKYWNQNPANYTLNPRQKHWNCVFSHAFDLVHKYQLHLEYYYGRSSFFFSRFYNIRDAIAYFLFS